jgi:hypothetical protein
MPNHRDVSTEQLLAMQWRAAVDHIVATVQTAADRCPLPDGSVWYDVRPMISPDEQPAYCLDRNRELLLLGAAMGVLGRSPDPGAGHLVHINAAA